MHDKIVYTQLFVFIYSFLFINNNNNNKSSLVKSKCCYRRMNVNFAVHGIHNDEMFTVTALTCLLIISQVLV